MGRQDFETEMLITDSLYIDDFDSIEDGSERGGPLAPIAICTAHTKSNGRRFSEDLAYALVRGSNQAVAFNLRGRQGGADSGDVAPTLRSLGHDAVAISANQRGELRESPVHGSLTTSRSSKQFNGVMQKMAVRRLTPRECERLQGFPDDYTLIEYRGKPASDGPRYKALGNSMAVPVMRWIGERIAAVHAIPGDLESHAR
jgi:DNA (cytosine-5)-methyltransferase 1